MGKRTKKSPIYIAYMHIEEDTFAGKGKNLHNHPNHICIYASEPKKSHPQLDVA